MPSRKPPLGNALRYGEGTIASRGEKFMARWFNLDGQRKTRTFPTRDQAEDHLRSVYRQKRDNRYVSPTEITVEALVRQYIERGRQSSWKSSTYATHSQRARSLIYPDLGSGKAIELVTPKVQWWIDKMGRDKQSPSTINSAYLILSGAFREAVRIGVLPNNPAANVRLPKTRSKAHVTWTDDHIRTALRHLVDEPLWHALYRLVLLTGMRPGESRSLRWSDIDFTSNIITIQRTVTRDEKNRPTMGTSTKTDTVRTVAFPETCAKALIVWRTEQKLRRLRSKTWNDGGYVFTGQHGKFLSDTTWMTYHRAMIEKIGVPRITLHEMRHSNATTDMAAGVHPKIVSERLGHKKIETTLNLYSHVSAELQRAAIEAMERRLDSEIPAPVAAPLNGDS